MLWYAVSEGRALGRTLLLSCAPHCDISRLQCILVTARCPGPSRPLPCEWLGLPLCALPMFVDRGGAAGREADLDD